MSTLESVEAIELDAVSGGVDPNFGRCGPGAGMAYLGDVRTPECARHDALVDGYLAQGSSTLVAQVKAVPALPAAIGSYVDVRYHQLVDAVSGHLK